MIQLFFGICPKDLMSYSKGTWSAMCIASPFTKLGNRNNLNVLQWTNENENVVHSDYGMLLNSKENEVINR